MYCIHVSLTTRKDAPIIWYTRIDIRILRKPLSQHYNNEPGQGSQYLWTHHWLQQQNVAATSERKMTKNKTMMQQIHKASARETKSMEQITLELSRHLRKKPKSARFAPDSAPGHRPMKRNLTLDVVRGLLSWLVVAVHVLWFACGMVRNEVRETMGIWAVEGFVILSGFVITGLLERKREHYGAFIVRRYFRLAPAFLVCVGLGLIVRLLGLGWQGEEKGNLLWHLGTHVALIHGLIPGFLVPGSDMALLPPGWSISLELQLYLVAPLLVWGVRRYGPRVLVLAVGLGLFCLLPPVVRRLEPWSALGAFLPQKFFWFGVGMCLYYAVNAESFARASEGWVRTRVGRGLVWLGEISYSTYLVHWPLLLVINVMVARSWSQPFRAAMIGILTVPTVLGASYLLHRYVELPGIALGRRLTSKKQTLSSVAEPPPGELWGLPSI